MDLQVLSIPAAATTFLGGLGGGSLPLKGDCTIAVLNEVPMPGMTSLTTNEATTQLMGDGPFANVAVYVSATGDDTAGDGTDGAPYATLDRALRDIRACGWDDTAEIRILSTGGLFTWPETINLNGGDRGAQRKPLTIRGWNSNPNPGRTLIAMESVTGSTYDTDGSGRGSGLLTLSGVGPFAGTQNGQRVRFTSGPLSTYNIIPGSTVEVDLAIADVPSPTSLLLPFNSLISPGIGDTFVIEALDTVVRYNGNTTVQTGGKTVILEDLIIAPSAVSIIFGRASIFWAVGAGELLFSGVNFIPFSGGAPLTQFAIIAKEGLLLQAGLTSLNPTNGVSLNTKGLFVDTSTLPSTLFFIVTGDFTTAVSLEIVGNGQFAISNSTFRLNPTSSGGVLFGKGLVQQNYFSGMVIGVRDGGLTLEKAWVENVNIPTIIGSAGILAVLDEGSMDVRDIRIQESTVTAIHVTNTGTMCLNDAVIDSLSGTFDLVRVQSCAKMVLNEVVIRNSALTGDFFNVVDNSRLTFDNLVMDTNNTQSGASNALINLENNSQLSSVGLGGLTLDIGVGNSLGNGLRLVGSSCNIQGSLTSSNHGSGTGVIVQSGQLSASQLTVNSNISGLTVFSSGEVTLTGLTASLNIFRAVSVTANSKLHVGSSMTLGTSVPTQNGAGLCLLFNSECIVGTDITCSFSTAAGGDAIFLQGESELSVGRDVTTNSNTLGGINVERGSSMVVQGLVTSSFNSDNGVHVQESSRMYCRGLITIGNAGTTTAGIFIQGNSILESFGDITSNDNTPVNIDLRDDSKLSASAGAGAASIDAGTTMATAANTGPNISMNQNCSLLCTGMLDCSFSPTFGLRMQRNCEAYIATISAVSNMSTGVSVEVNSMLTILSGTTDSNGGSGIMISRTSQFNGSSLTSNLNTGGQGIIIGSASSAELTSVTCNSNTSEGISVSAGSIARINSATCNSNTLSGIAATDGSTVHVNGTTCMSNARPGFNIQNGSTGNLSTCTSDGNTNGFDISNASMASLIGCAANGNTVGVFIARGSSVSATSLTGTGNATVGVDCTTNSKFSSSVVPTITGPAGMEVTVGTNATTTWAAVSGAGEAVKTDFANVPTELCMVFVP